MQYQDNVVRMWLSAKGYTNVGASYTIDEFSITTGQDPDHHIYQGLIRTYFKNKGYMSFSVGQSSSSAVGVWWKQMVAPSQTTPGWTSMSSTSPFSGRSGSR